MAETQHIELPSCEESLPGALSQLNATVEHIGARLDLPASWTFATQLVLEEAFTNIVHYGSLQSDSPITVELRMDDGGFLNIVLCDHGIAFDPFGEARAPDRQANAEHRTVGGLGVFLIKELVDEYRYERVADMNLMTLRIAAHQ